MRIALVSREYPPSQRAGGIATYVQETARKMAQLGHTVYVIAASDDIHSSTKELDAGVTVFRLSGADFYICNRNTKFGLLRSKIRGMLNYRSYRRNVASCLNALEEANLIDVIEFADFGNEGAEWIKSISKTPWIVRLHGPTLLDRSRGAKISALRNPIAYYHGQKELETIRQANVVTSPTDAMARLVSSWCSRRNDIVTIGNHIDVERWARSPSDVIDPESNDRSSIIFSAGTVSHEKGHFDLVKAVELLKGQGMKIQLKIAGRKGRLARQLAKRKSTSIQNGYIELLGPLPRDDLSDLYGRSDLVVFPSWWEPFGLVCVEAMASGALVLGSLCGGMKEIIEDEKSGYLISPSDPAALAEKISNILSLNIQVKNQVRLNARKRAEIYDSDCIVKKQLEIYQRAIDSRAEQKS